MLGLSALSLLAGAITAQAREVRTECPPVAPSDGKTLLGYNDVLHYGDVAHGVHDPDFIETVGNIRRVVYVAFPAEFRMARIECTYGPRGRPWISRVYVDIPGLLLRCERTFRVPSGHQRHPDDRYWCISRVDD